MSSWVILAAVAVTAFAAGWLLRGWLAVVYERGRKP